MYNPNPTWPTYYPAPCPWYSPQWYWSPPTYWPQPFYPYWPPPTVWCGQANATQVGTSLATARPTP